MKTATLMLALAAGALAGGCTADKPPPPPAAVQAAPASDPDLADLAEMQVVVDGVVQEVPEDAAEVKRKMDAVAAETTAEMDALAAKRQKAFGADTGAQP